MTHTAVSPPCADPATEPQIRVYRARTRKALAALDDLLAKQGEALISSRLMREARDRADKAEAELAAAIRSASELLDGTVA